MGSSDEGLHVVPANRVGHGEQLASTNALGKCIARLVARWGMSRRSHMVLFRRLDGHMQRSADDRVPNFSMARSSHPGTDDYENLPQFPARFPLSFRRTIRRPELHQIVPLAETTIYEMEQRGEFPRRFNLTPRCVVWDLDEIDAWIEARKRAARSGDVAKSAGPDVRQRRSRPVRNAGNL